MNRIIYYDLVDWHQVSHRKPLLIRGARQVGKTHLVRQFGERFENFVEINFEKRDEFVKIFDNDLDPKRIIRDLTIMEKMPIIAGKTLLFLDEIQQAPRAITGLRYFYEEMPDLHVIAAGSLVDFAIEKVGVPVGRINYLFMYPMSFIEFLYAMGYQQLAMEIVNHSPTNPLNEAIHELALRLFGEYMALGGMPGVVSHWVKDQDITSCVKVLQGINNVYEDDFGKYAKKHEIKYLDLLFKTIPSLISQQFKYSLVTTIYRKRELEPAILLLEKAGIIHRIFHSHGQGLPLGAEINFDKFKIIFLDIGLNQAILGLKLEQWFLNPSAAMINKGNVAESYVGQELLAYGDPTQKPQLFYWHREKPSSQAEVDYITEIASQVVPIEVKSGRGSTLQSMRIFLDEHKNSEYGVRFSMHNYSNFDSIYSYPLYAVAGILGNKERLLRFLNAL